MLHATRPAAARAMAISLTMLCLLAGSLVAQTTSAPREQVEPVASPRLREGTTIVDQRGVFKIQGDRATFYPDGAEQGYGGLENLNLARVHQAIREAPDQLHWIVSGQITEYNGANYLLVTRAVRTTTHVASRRP